MVPVLYIFSYFLGALAIVLVLPALVAGSVGETALIPDFLLTSALLVFLAGAVMLSLRGRERRLRPAQRYLLAVMLWLLLPAFAALPMVFALENIRLLDAYFEAVSALTTTGARVIAAPEFLPRSILFWLALVQWLGGALTLLIVVLVLAPSGAGGLPEAHQRLVEHGGLPEKRRLLMILKDLMPIYVAATGLCFLLLAFTGLAPFEALSLAFAAVSTGGFAPRSAELGSYVSSTGLFILSVFMIVGATSVLWHRDIVNGRWRAVLANRESWWVIAICAGLGIFFALAYARASGQASLIGLSDGFFTATSLVTTTGLEVRYAGFEILPITLVFLFVAVGAAGFSTAGGIKLFRIGAMVIQSGRELNRLVYPHAIRPARFGSQTYDIQIMKAIWSGFLVFIAGAVALSWLIASEGVAYEGALLAALSILSNAGPVYASDWAIGQEWLTYAQMSASTRLALCLGMILGRLEIIAALALIVFARRHG
jgi:trk system potassium uptake protein